MSYLSHISKQMSSELGNKLNKDEEQIAVFEYSLFIILHTITTILITLIVGIITKTFTEIAIITTISALFKRYSGGVHASSPVRCTIIGLIISLSMALLCKSIAPILDKEILIMIIIISNLVAYYILYKKCPVPSKNKPLKNIKLRKMLRKKAFRLANLLITLELILFYLYTAKNVEELKGIIISILLGMLMQVFVLTDIGKIFIEKIDNALKVVI